jgi:hypothetical protein
MRDGAVRRTLKAAARAVFFLNLHADRTRLRLLGARPYQLGGDCRRCAACCEAPAIRVPALVWLAPLLRRAFLWWQEKVNGFVLAEALRAERTFVFRCTHFDGTTRSCDSYASRPGICRDYPRALLWQTAPELLPGCGYRPIARNAAALRRALDARPLTDEQRERLARQLFLE